METVSNKGGAICVEQRNRRAQACFARAGHVVAVGLMDIGTVAGVGALARSSVRLAGATIEGSVSMFLNVWSKRTGDAALGAAENAVGAGVVLANSTARGAAVTVGNGVAEAGAVTPGSVMQSFVPFVGTQERIDKAEAACSNRNE